MLPILIYINHCNLLQVLFILQLLAEHLVYQQRAEKSLFEETPWFVFVIKEKRRKKDVFFFVNALYWNNMAEFSFFALLAFYSIYALKTAFFFFLSVYPTPQKAINNQKHVRNGKLAMAIYEYMLSVNEIFIFL